MNKILDLIVKDNYISSKPTIEEDDDEYINIEPQLRLYLNSKLRKHLNFDLYHLDTFNINFYRRHKYFYSTDYEQFLSYEFFTQYILINDKNKKKYKNKNKYYDSYFYKFKSFYLTKIVFIQDRNFYIYYISNPTKKYDNNYFLDGFLLLICDIKKKRGTIVDMRIKKEFLIKNNKKLEKRELYFYKILIHICYKYKIHKIIVNDSNNFYYDNQICDMFTYYYPIYKKSWYEDKLFFTFTKSSAFDKRDSLYNPNDYILLKKRLKKYKIKNFSDSCNIVKKYIYKKNIFYKKRNNKKRDNKKIDNKKNYLKHGKVKIIYKETNEEKTYLKISIIKKLLYNNYYNYHLLNLFSKKFLYNYVKNKYI